MKITAFFFFVSSLFANAAAASLSRLPKSLLNSMTSRWSIHRWNRCRAYYWSDWTRTLKAKGVI